MKRTFGIGLTLALCLMLVVSTLVSAQSTSKNLVTNFVLVNLSPDDAEGSINYYKEDGSAWTGSGYTSFGPGQTHELPGDGGQLTVRQYSDTLTAGRGSVMVASNVQLGAVVQLRLAPGDTTLPSSSAYVGVNEGSSKYYLPLVQARRVTGTGLANTQIMVQNLGDSAIDFNINFFAEPGSGSTPATYTKSVTGLQPGATFFYDLQQEAALNDGWNGSAEVDAGVNKVAVVVNSFNGLHGLRTYNGFPEENVGTTWGIPLFASKLSNGLNTSVSVQNLSGADIPVGGLTLTCPDAPGGYFPKSNTAVIPDKGTFAFNPVGNTSYPNDWQGACVINAGSADIVAFVIMRRVTGNGDQAAYEAINYSGTNTTVFVPLMAKRLANGFATSAVIQNLSANDAHVDLIWTPNPTECVGACLSYTQSDVTIPANGNLPINLRLAAGGFPGMNDGWQGTLKVVPNAGYTARPIDGYVVLSSLANSVGDNYRAHALMTLP